MKLNSSWYSNNNCECGLNPRLKFVNSNSDEENIAIIKWADQNGIELIVLDKYSDKELNRERKFYRYFLKRALEDRIDVEANDCSLRGFGTFAENKFYTKKYDETLSNIREKYAEEFELERKYREEEKREEFRSLGMDPDCPCRSV